MAPCVQLLVHMTNKIKLEASGPVNKCYKVCYEVHTDMAGGDSVAIYTWSSTCLISEDGVYDCICSVSEAIIQGRLL